MTTYVMKIPHTREFRASNQDELLHEISSSLLCDKWGVDSMLKNIANACCDWQGEVIRYGNASELIEDLIDYKILIKKEGKADEES